MDSREFANRDQQATEPDAFVASAVLPADPLRERLLSFMVHEIRNPLASTLWSAEMLARKPSGDGRNDRLAQLAARSVRRLRMLLEDLFALERVPEHPEGGQVDLHEAIERVLAPRDIEPAGLKATVDGETHLRVSGDPLLVDRLLHACLRRVSHLGSADARTGIRVHEEGNTAVVEISRTGVSAEEIEPPPLSPGGSEGEGTTFAMLLARAIAQRLGVTLQVTTSDGGAKIVLSLPTTSGPPGGAPVH